MDETLPAVRHQSRLLVTPVTQRLGPLPRTSEVEDPMAAVDDRAVDEPRDHGRGLPGGDRDHRLVPGTEALRRAAELHQRLALTEQAERPQVRVVETPCQRIRLTEPLQRRLGSALAHRHEALRHQEVSALGTVHLVLVDHASCTGQPAAALGHVAPLHQTEAEPERRADRALQLATLVPPLVGARPGVGALRVVTRQVRRGRQPFEIRGLEWLGGVGTEELFVCVVPVVTIEGRSTSRQEFGRQKFGGIHAPLPEADGTPSRSPAALGATSEPGSPRRVSHGGRGRAGRRDRRP